MTYPIAEIFHSIQGEGRWTGTPMMFVRLAGCNVGRYHDGTPSAWGQGALLATPDEDEAFKLFEDKKHSVCITFDGQRFLCDTDYHATEKLSAAQIFERLESEDHICITGGEPFLYDLQPLANEFQDLHIHIETSGTKEPLPFIAKLVWITCCPKRVGPQWKTPGVRINEWKVLVGPDLDTSLLYALDGTIEPHCKHRYLQPINGVHEVWKENLDHCLKLLKEFPHWKLSAQLHKYIGAR